MSGKRNIDNKRLYEKTYYQEVNKEKKIQQVTERRLKRLYNISSIDYDNLLASQDNRCKICNIHRDNTHKGLHIDHCHETGKVRGLLCYKCNTGLGQFNDDPVLLEKAKGYLNDC